MEIQGKGVNAKYVVGPLHWGGRATLTENGVGKYKITIVEDPTWEEAQSVFEYFTDEQMQELFLAYIALKEARERENADSAK